MTKIKEMNCTTGEEIERDMTAQELEQLTVDLAERAEKVTEQQVKEEAKAALRSKLGITAEEAELLLA